MPKEKFSIEIGGEHLDVYRRPPLLEESVNLAPDVMTKQEFEILDERQERFLSETSRLFPVDSFAQRLKSFASQFINRRFKKGDRQFAAVGRAPGMNKLLGRLQQDFRLGNTNTCAERLLLDAAREKGVILDSMVVYRGEKVENAEVNIVTTEGGRVGIQGTLRTIQERGGESTINHKAVMRHMVAPCAYCREALCRHNPTCMSIMPPGRLKAGETTMQLPAFMIYPDNDLFEEKDPLLAQLEKSDSPELLEARKRQKKFFKEVAKDYPLTAADKALYREAVYNMESVPITDEPYMLIRARTITNQRLEKVGKVKPSPDLKDMSFLEYYRNDVEIRFVDEMLEEPHFPPAAEDRPGSSHSLHVFVALYRKPKSDEFKPVLPNADTRQRMVERFYRSFVLVELDGELAKLPFILFYPNRYKRLDKKQIGGRG